MSKHCCIIFGKALPKSVPLIRNQFCRIMMCTHDRSDSLADQGHSHTYQEKECFCVCVCVCVDAKLFITAVHSSRTLAPLHVAAHLRRCIVCC